MPDGIADGMADRMPDRLLEYMPDKMRVFLSHFASSLLHFSLFWGFSIAIRGDLGARAGPGRRPERLARISRTASQKGCLRLDFDKRTPRNSKLMELSDVDSIKNQVAQVTFIKRRARCSVWARELQRPDPLYAVQGEHSLGPQGWHATRSARK